MRSGFLAACMAALLVVLAAGSGARADVPGPADRAALRGALDRLDARVAERGRDALGSARDFKARLRAAGLAAASAGQVRVVHVDGDVAIDPDAQRIDATLRLTVRFLKSGTNAFQLLAFLPILAIENADGTAATWSSDQVQGYPVARVDVADYPEAGGTRDFTVHVGGVPDCSMSGPISVNLCAWGSVIYVAGDMFVPGAVGDDFSTADLRVTLPAGYVLAATGITTSVTPGADGTEVHHVEQPFPTDSRSFGIARYEEARIPWGDAFISPFTKGDDAKVRAGVPEVLADMKSILQYYSDRFGAFLFPKMEACQVTNDAGAAFGWPALLWIPDGMFRHGGSSRTALFAHELGHQWFPDMVKNDDAWAAWLSEGFAEYMSTEYMGTVLGADYPAAVYNGYGEIYMYFIDDAADYGLSSMESAWVSDSWVYQIVTYYKGAITCHILEKVVGTDAWNRALKAMHDDLAGREDYYDTRGLQEYLEAASGMDLEDVFMNWVYRKGYPTCTVDVARQVSQEGSPQAVVRVRQVSSNANNRFRMTVKLGLVTDEGETIQAVRIDQEDQSFTFDLPGRLVRVRFDPDRDFLKRVEAGLPGDMDLSGEIDGIDLLYAAWAQGGVLYGQSDNFLSSVDFDRNAMVDDADLAVVTDGFGSTAGGGAR